MEQWCNSYRVRIVTDLKSDRHRWDLHKSNLPVTSRKIGHVSHQLVSNILGLPWGIISFSLNSYLFVIYSPQKAQKCFNFRCLITSYALQFHFQICFVEFVSLVAGFDCVRRRSSISPLLFFVSTAIPSIIFQTTSWSHHITWLAPASRLVWSLAAALTLDRLLVAVILPASQPSLHH
jgi:hypothetical protein